MAETSIVSAKGVYNSTVEATTDIVSATSSYISTVEATTDIVSSLSTYVATIINTTIPSKITTGAIYNAVVEVNNSKITAGAIYNAVVETNNSKITAGAIYIAAFPISAPLDPSDLTATAISASAIDLAWVDNSSNEDNFELQRDKVNTFDSVDLVTLYPIADSTTYNDIGLDASTTYFYRIRAVNLGGNSDYSNIASDTTFDVLDPSTSVIITASGIYVYFQLPEDDCEIC